MEAALKAETDIATAIIASGIADEPVTHLVEGAMRRLVSAGCRSTACRLAFASCTPCSTA